MLPLPRSRGRAAATAFLAGCLLSACVHPKAPGVGISPLQSDIVFGVKTDAETALPAGFSEPIPSQAVATADLPAPRLPAAQPTSDPATKLRPNSAPPVKRECPDAALNAFPDKIASSNVPANVLPAMGQYRFKKKGTIMPTGLTFSVVVDGFETRTLRNLVVASQATAGTPSDTNPDGYQAKYTYEEVTPRLDGNGSTITTYQVFTNGRTGELSVTNPTGNNVNYREPEAGLTIKKIESFDKDGLRTGIFAPETGLLIMPLGIRTGERFQSVAVDPTSGQSQQLSGFIRDKARIDACGVITEGWAIETTITSSGTSSGSRTYNFVGSTNLGGIVISEDIHSTESAGQYDITFSLGQLTPDHAAA